MSSCLENKLHFEKSCKVSFKFTFISFSINVSQQKDMVTPRRIILEQFYLLYRGDQWSKVLLIRQETNEIEKSRVISRCY